VVHGDAEREAAGEARGLHGQHGRREHPGVELRE
jgi:hypothetical protein